MKIKIVIDVSGDEESIKKFYRRLQTVVEGEIFEFEYGSSNTALMVYGCE